MDEELGIGDIFPEPERPPSPEPTIEVFHRRREDASKHDWDKVDIRLVGSHPLWGHHLWNAAKSFASYLDDNSATLCSDKNVLELGAGGALPGIVSLLQGARKAVLTDYPDPPLVDNITHNVETNVPEKLREHASVQGYIWGHDVTPLLQALSPADASSAPSPSDPLSRDGFDVIILSDLVFNHAAHDSLLDTCAKTIKLDAETRPLADESSSAVSSSPTHTPVVLVFYTHHRPHLAHRDLDFFAKARQRGWICEEFYTEKPGPMFPTDPGDLDVRSTVHGWRMYVGPQGVRDHKIDPDDEE